MSKTIDERVVEMRFDNAEFEKNVKTSITSLDKLKNSLKIGDSAKSFKALNNSAEKVDLSGMSNGLDTVSNKFNILEKISTGVLERLGQRIYDTGERMIKSLTIDQVIEGYNKFNEKVHSTATIMSATGKSVEEVEEQLGKLNWFSDETSANFVDMTNNIGKFTNAGVPLETAVTAMQGISTWGYKSGATINEMGRAMYNLSQAMAVGSVKLMDWKSIENANMATTEFKQTAIDTAVAMGTLKDVGDGVYETLSGNTVSVTNFNAALSDAWFTSDVLTGALNTYGSFANQLQEACEETDTYATEFISYYQRYIDGVKDGTEEAKIAVEDFTENYNKANSSAIKSGEKVALTVEDASKMFQKLSYNKAYIDDLAKSLSETEEGAYELSDTLLDAFIDSKNGTLDLNAAIEQTGLTADQLNDVFSKMEKNTNDLGFAAFKASQEARTFEDAIAATKDAVSTSWMNIFQSIFGNYEQAKEIWTKLSEDLYTIFVDPLNNFGDAIIDAMAAGGRDELIGGFETIFESLLTVIETIRDTWGEVFDDNTQDKIRSFTSGFQKFAEYISITADEAKTYLAPVLKVIFKIIKQISNIIGGAIKGVFGIFKNIIDLIMGSKTFNVVIDKIANGFNKLSKISLDDLYNSLTKFIDQHKFLESFSQVLTSVRRSFNIFFREIKRYDFSNFSLKSFIDYLKNDKAISFAFKSISSKFKQFGESVKEAFNNFKEGNFKGISEAVSNFLNGLGIDFEKIKGTVSKVFNWIKNFLSNLTLGKILSAALAGLYVAISVWFIKFAKMATTFGFSLSGITDSLQDLFKNTGLGIKKWLKSKSAVETAKAVQTYAIAIGILVAAISVLAIVDSKGGNVSKAFGIVSGLMVLTGIIIILLTKLAKAKTLSDAARQTVSGLGKSGMLVALAAAILMAAIAFKVISTSDLDHMGKVLFSFVVIAAVMIAAATAMAAIAKFIGPQMVTGASSMLIFAGSMYLMALTFQKLAGLEGNLSEARKSLVTLGFVVAGLMAVGSLVGKKVLKSGVGLLLITFSLKSLIKVFEQLDAAHIDINAKAEEYKKFFESLSLILGALSVTYFIAGKSGIKAAIGLIAMIGVLYLLIKAIEKISDNSEGLTLFGSAIADHLVGGLKKLVIGIGVALAIANIGGGAVKSLSGSILATAASLFVISGTFILLTTVFQKVRWQDIVKGLVGIATIMGLMTVAMLAAGKSKNMYKNFTGIAIAVGALTAVLIALTFIDPKKLAIASIFVVGISALIAGLMLVFKRFGKIRQKDLAAELIMLGAISLVIAGFGFLIGYLAGINGIEKALPAAIAIGVLVLALAGTMILISSQAMVINKGIAILKTIKFGEMISVAAKLSATIVLVMVILSAGIALAIGITAVIIAGIGKIFENSNWEEALNNGIEMMTKLGDGIGQMIGALKGGIIKGEANSLGDTADELISFSERIKEFSTNMNSVDDGVQAKMEAVSKIINTISNASIKDKKINRFISALKQIGPAIKEFGASVADGQLEKAETIFLLCTAIEALNDVKVDKFDEIKKGLGSLVDSFKETFSSENLKSMSDTASGFFGQMFSGEAFDISGAFNFFGGENGSEGMTSMIQNFIGDAGSNINYEDIVSQMGIGDALPEEISKAIQNGDYSSLGEGIETGMSSEIVDIDMTSSGSAIINNLSTAIEANAVTLNETGLVLARELEKGVEDYDFGEGGSIIVSLLCKGIEGSTEYMSETGLALVRELDKGVENYDFGEGGSIIVSLLCTGIEGSSEYMHEAGLALMREFDSGAEDYDFGESGSIIVSLFAEGLENSGSDLVTTGTTLGKKVISGLTKGSAGANTIGENIIQGFINGLNNKSGDLYTLAYNIGRQVAQSVKDGAGEKSPSKLTYEVGRYIDEGLILGMQALESKVYKEGNRIGKSSTESFSDAISKMITAINTDFDFNPTITPVLDLSQIQNGAGILNGMFGNPGLSINGTANLVRQVGLSVPASNSRSYSSSSVNNLYIDGIKYNSDEYVDKSINDFVVSMIRKART